MVGPGARRLFGDRTDAPGKPSKQQKRGVVSVFYSFHYARDYWRVQQVMNIGAIDNNGMLNHQEWESVKRGGDRAIMNWIDRQMKYTSAVIVLVGAQTASRPWVRYEIDKALAIGKPVLGVRVNGLKDHEGRIDQEGANPFDYLGYERYLIPLHTPFGWDSASRYADIRLNLKMWSEGGYVRR